MALTQSQSRLWARLSSFRLDNPSHPVTFTERLRREQGWTREFTGRVVDEYRRFLLIAASADDMMVPSEEVDQAWHLHMVDTRSYWDGLCRDVIGKQLHHTPTRGGDFEQVRHENRYESTLLRYREVFGEEPPIDVWPPSTRRFTGRYRRVNLDDALVIRKAPLLATIGAAFVVVLAGCAHAGVSTSTIAGFGILGVLCAVVAGVAWAAPRRERSDRNSGGCGGASGGIGGCSCPGSTGCGGSGGGCGGGCGS